MTIYAKIITLAAVLVALASGAPLQAQTPEIDALRARAEEGVASAQFSLGFMYATGLAGPAGRCAGAHVVQPRGVTSDR